ncbi:Excinuclease ABC subunit B [Aminomonas paucivorans DSM 12260]|uniref:UvrABC system protein B n=1 Tax=Aminomonas paucivorans DSM 12260 TaxID=584708 RepID=E3D124_9BACT|nr:excinuclease ABC subunit UvrB [Aminomonas paucivorans]EFQ23930.1 Excinuclease ABC subunit B [Aminomonas paucivorans DSM 12260]
MEGVFRLVADWDPAGDQPEAIEALVRGFEGGLSRQTLLGVTGSGKTYTMAQVVQRLQRPTLVMAHNKTLAAQLYSEFKGFFPENAVQYFVSYYDYYQPEAYMPAQDLYIEKDASINERIEKLRLSTTKALLERRDVLVVASVSCIYGLGKRKNYEEAIFRFQVGETWPRKRFLERLLANYYERNDVAFTPGVFRVRGDLLEIYPAYSDTALRVSFLDDEIDRIDEIDPVSGKTLLRKDRGAVFPAQHYVTSPDAIAQAMEKIEQELKAHLEDLRSRGRLLEAQRLESRTRYDMEMLQEVGYCSGIENYSRFLDGREVGETPGTLMDFFPQDYLLFLDESHITIPQIRGMYNGDRARKEVLVEHGFRLPSCLDNRPLRFEEFESFMGQALFVSATPGDYEIQTSARVVEQLVRPTGVLEPQVEVRPATGQVDDLLEELRLVAERGDRALVTTLTKRSAEDLAEYFAELGIQVRYIHSELDTFERAALLKDLRQGVFGVLVGVNLLREGLDLPEVSLVAILEADREGYLRSHRSLIQMIGRAARNEAGKVILYGDRVTDSMRLAVEETQRRRRVQETFNRERGIVPTTVRKEIKSLLPQELLEDQEERTPQRKGSVDRKELERMMWAAVERLDFEEAAALRDQITNVEGHHGVGEHSDTRRKAAQSKKRRRRPS